MRVFISWSGNKSHKVALVFRDWLPSVIQSIEPYVSSEDIDKGARWSTDIAKELENSTFGILCVTKDNLEAPWLSFEAGALSKTMDKAFVSPFLFDIKRSEVNGPILQFQSTIFQKEDLKKLVTTLNKACGENCIPESRLEKAFEVWFPTLETELNKIKDVIDYPDEIKKKESLNIKFENYQIVGKNISFRYPDNDKMIFDKFNFIIPDKKITYIKGSNGSGKTTLMEMILSVLKPLKGEIYGMKNGKKEIMEGKLGYVPQKSEFFNTTIFRNLTLDKNYSEEEVADVLKKVNMYSVIEKFPKKLDTVFGENTNFSAGQLRRLSIARSLLFKPDFIFLDEPFSDLDIENQKILMTLFQELKNIMGIVIITHTYDFITENDNIIEVGDVNEK